MMETKRKISGICFSTTQYELIDMTEKQSVAMVPNKMQNWRMMTDELHRSKSIINFSVFDLFTH